MASIPLDTSVKNSRTRESLENKKNDTTSYNSLSEKKLLSLKFIDINQKGMETGHAFDIDNKK